MVKTNYSIFDLPVSFHIFNRPEITKKTFDVIRVIKPKYLFVTADGPRENIPEEAEQCKFTRKIIENGVDWDCKLYTNYSQHNRGSYKCTSEGISWVFNHVEEAIILEDDCLPSLSFFRFCRELLDYYRNDSRIAMISGNNFMSNMKKYKYSYYFTRYPHIWGWATWKRTWDDVNLEMEGWEEFLNSGGLKTVFSNNSEIYYWRNIFQNMYDNVLSQHWDYKFTLSIFMNNAFTILPRTNLVSNIGAGANATNCKVEGLFHNLPVNEIQFPLLHPKKIYRLHWADYETERTIFSRHRPPLLVSFKKKIKTLLKI